MKKQCFLVIIVLKTQILTSYLRRSAKIGCLPDHPVNPPLDFAGFGPEGGGLLAIDRLICLQMILIDQPVYSQ